MIEIEKFNESFLRVFGDRDVLQEIKDFFTFKAPGYKYHPKYKARLWDGNISLFNMQTNKLPHGFRGLYVTCIFKRLFIFATANVLILIISSVNNIGDECGILGIEHFIL